MTTSLHDGFRARIASLVEAGRAIPAGSDLCDAVERDADAIATACADEATAAVDAVVPPDLRPAVLARLVERIDLVPWARSARDAWALAWSLDLMRGAVEDGPDDDVPPDEVATPEEAALIQAFMLAKPLALYPLWTRDHDQNATTHVLFGAAIDAITPPKRRQEVDAIAARASAKTRERDPLTVRLVAWLFLDEMAPEWLAETAAGAVLAEDAKKGHNLATHPMALRELARRVEDVIPAAPKPTDDVDVVDGVQPLDEDLAGMVEGTGETGRKLAGVIRDTKKKTPEERAARWRPLVDPLRVPRILARALWDDVVSVVLRGDMEQEAHARERREKVPAPTMHPAPRSAILFAPLGGWRTNRDGSLETGDVDKRRGYLPPVAMVSVGERALSSSAGKIVPTLAALLSREAWDRWVRGVDRFDWIAVPAGRNALHARGIDATEDELDEAIAWLQDLKVGGLPCIDASPPPQEVMGDERHAGRPEKRRIVRVGAPLAPMGLESVYRDAGMVLPPELRFFSPVLDPAEAPLIGHRQTYARQRDFYALGIGSFFVEHREQYAERGGVRIDLQAWRRFLDARGIYHRSHHSLADQMWDAYRGHRKPGLPGIGPRAAVLVETAHGSGVYRLGPDFAEQERVIMNAAKRTAKRRRDSKKRGAAKRRGETDS
jgi:hypothetical protein